MKPFVHLALEPDATVLACTVKIEHVTAKILCQLSSAPGTQTLRGCYDRLDLNGLEVLVLDESSKLGEGTRITIEDIRPEPQQPAVILRHHALVHNGAAKRLLAARVPSEPLLEISTNTLRRQLIVNPPNHSSAYAGSISTELEYPPLASHPAYRTSMVSIE